MKTKSIFILILLLLISSIGFAEETNKVYIVPIKGEINRATYNYLKDVMKDINNEDNVEAIIFEIDTYGGLINEAEKIKNLILSTNIPTISFVNNKAESAGVLLAIASEKVVMASNATIGSAEPNPNTEKVLSLWRSMLRDTAQYRNRNYQIIEAMADKDIIINGVTHKGKLVNLTSKESLKYGVADYISDDYNDILTYFNIVNANVVQMKEGLSIKLAKYISSPYISSILLALGFIGMVVEILTPGFGIGGTVSIIGFGLYFGGNILAGNSNWTSLALFATGLILLLIEGLIPGFGLPGISGIILVVLGTILAMDNLTNAILSVSISIIITTIVSVILLKLGFRSKLLDEIILKTNHNTQKSSINLGKEVLLGKEGIAVSELRPTGFIEIDGERYDALTEGYFLPKGTPVIVAKVEGIKIFVRRK